MWLPFRRNRNAPKMVRLPSVTRTDEEGAECERCFRQVFPNEENGDAWYASKDVAEVLTQSLFAQCLTHCAKRFSIMRRFPEACEAASKACCIDAQSTNFYTFATILEEADKDSNARTMFPRRHQASPAVGRPA